MPRLPSLPPGANLESHPDTARVSSLSDFYRARFLYRLSQGGEAVEASLALFVQTLQRRAELQTVALEDIANRLQALQALAGETEADVAKIHETLRDLVRVFEGLAENAQALEVSARRYRRAGKESETMRLGCIIMEHDIIQQMAGHSSQPRGSPRTTLAKNDPVWRPQFSAIC
jgi:uncharacterized protein (TIGR02677 family)